MMRVATEKTHVEGRRRAEPATGSGDRRVILLLISWREEINTSLCEIIFVVL